MAAQIVNGIWQSDVSVRNDAADVTHVSTQLDQLITAVSWVVIEAQPLSRENKKRLAQFFYAAGEMVSERTRLDPADQKIFEAHLRDVAARKHGV